LSQLNLKRVLQRACLGIAVEMTICTCAINIDRFDDVESALEMSRREVVIYRRDATPPWQSDIFIGHRLMFCHQWGMCFVVLVNATAATSPNRQHHCHCAAVQCRH
jgi:hypothetical protein